MRDAEWEDSGTVLSSVTLEEVPETIKAPSNMVIVEVGRRGPKIICWSDEHLVAGNPVDVVDLGERLYTCHKR